MSSSCSLLLFLLSLSGVKLISGFKICAFNVQSFGDSKSRNTEVMHTLIRIVSRCDVCLLQEVRDTKQKAIPLLITELNRHNSQNQYDYVASERLGRTPSYQEQYVFVFRIGSVTVTDQYQYSDMLPGDEDAFSREPFIIRLHTPKTAIRDFVLVPQHTTPTNATKEIDALYDVFLDVKKKWKTEGTQWTPPLDKQPPVPTTGSWSTGRHLKKASCPSPHNLSTSPKNTASQRNRRWTSVTTTQWRLS
ncbi:deoxyribonuclease-1-like 1 isoform X2 [Oncorhynchus masou masou]|uniref:deoxyribonuclease-1-like 1 isoform X2 n=1 Tax=Oncorhynchus masou masou TaxID=90313 RepID=UPI003183A50E